MTSTDSVGKIESLKKSKTEEITTGAHNSANEMPQATENARRRSKLPTNNKEDNQKAANGNAKRGQGFGGLASPSSAAASSGRVLMDKISMAADSSGDVYKISHRRAPRMRFQ
mmetsp:Transcript_37327/g.84298  ORF Transcript_37327/g.84298 Transcript_37327/m.84298 type:complete len:113 (-) Transcript_37327:668-1006(-)